MATRSRPKETKPLCVVCNTRKAVALKRTACQPCALRTGAENTRKQYGLPSVREEQIDRERFIRVWDRIRDRGGTLTDIAHALKKSPKSVEKRATKLRKDGFELAPSLVASGKRKEPETPVDRSVLTRKANEHGGGKAGIVGCNCLPCLTARRKYRNDWNRANAEKVKQYQLKSDIKRGRRKPRPDVEPS